MEAEITGQSHETEKADVTEGNIRWCCLRVGGWSCINGNTGGGGYKEMEDGEATITRGKTKTVGGAGEPSQESPDMVIVRLHHCHASTQIGVLVAAATTAEG